jgi:ribosomal protein S18 acetylase RimI-like enzyme
MPDVPGGAGASPEIVRVPAVAPDTVTDVLTDAFASYPVMRFVLGPGGDPVRRLRRLVELFVAARALRDDPMFTAVAGGSARGAMTMSFPPGPEAPPAFARVRDEVWEELGLDARARYDACVEAWTPLGMDVPHAHVNMLGVRAAFRGEGLARLLLERAQETARATGEAEGVHLTTENPGNLLFYRHVGYEVVGHARISSSLETWALFRPN